MKISKNILITILVTSTFIGCSKYQTIYENPNIVNKKIKADKLEEDKTICELQSYQAFPLDNSSAPLLFGNKQGNFTINNISTGTTYQGTYTSNNSGFASGFSAGAAMVTSNKIKELRTKFFTLCMKKKGWTIKKIKKKPFYTK